MSQDSKEQHSVDTMPKFMNALYPIDAKLLQYYYLSEKINSYIKVVRHVKELMKNNPDFLVDPQSIILLSGSIFNINDNFYRRSEIIQNCQKFNPSQIINIPLLLSPVNFDSLENISRNSPVGPYGISLNKLVPLPNRKSLLDSIILLEHLLINANDIINKKFSLALKEFNNHHNLNYTKATLVTDIDQLTFQEFEIIENLKFTVIPKIDIGRQETILKYYLTNQFNFLELKLIIFQNIIDEVKYKIHKLMSSITKSKTSVQNCSTLYQMYLLLLKIADLYIEIRKSGKTIYFQNINYFQPYTRQNKLIRETVNKVSIYFTQSKQNGILLTLISKYAKRTEIKNVSLDFNIFISEFRKTSLEMINLLNEMIKYLKQLHDEWTMLKIEGKDNDFNKEYLREKLRERVAKDKEKRMSILLENQKELQVKMENQKAGSVTPKDTSHIQTMVSRMNSINEDNANNEAVESPTIQRRVVSSNNNSPQTVQRRLSTNSGPKVHRMSSIGSSVNSSRNNSLTTSTKSPFYRSSSLTSSSATKITMKSNSIRAPSSAPSASSAGSTPKVLIRSRSSSITNMASNSRSNSLTRTDSARQLMRKSSYGDLNKINENMKISDISAIDEDGDKFMEPPKIGAPRRVSNDSTKSNSRTSSLTSSINRSPSISRIPSNSAYGTPPQNRTTITRSPSISNTRTPNRTPTRTQSVNGSNVASRAGSRVGSRVGSRTNSLTASSTAAAKESLKRRTSINRSISHQQLDESVNGNGSIHAEDTANGKTIIRRQSMIDMSSKNSPDIKKAAALAASKKASTNTMLTAQQRLQQHILKSAKDGSVYGKPLDKRNSVLVKKMELKDDIILKPNPELSITPSSPIDFKDQEDIDDEKDDCVDMSFNFNEEEEEGEESEGPEEFPSSPLNSLKVTSLEAHNALKQKMINRSRSSSTTASISNNNNNSSSTTTNNNKTNHSEVLKFSPNKAESPSYRRLSPNKNSIDSIISPMQSPSPSRVSRSRSNSAVYINGNGSGTLSRRSSTASRSRAGSVVNGKVNYGGNTAVVSNAEEGVKFDSNGEAIKKVRFTGVNDYSEDEDAPTPMRMQKQIRQKWAAYKPLFRKLNSQEGLALKQNHHLVEENVNITTTLREDPDGHNMKQATPMSQKTLRSQANGTNGTSSSMSSTTAAFLATVGSGNRSSGSTETNTASRELSATKRLSRLFRKR